VKENYIILVFSVLVGVIFVFPQLLFVARQGSHYQGLPILQVDDADIYLARMREILDGHYLVSSPVFFEYKGEMPLLPPTGEYVYVILAYILGLSLTSTYILTQFLFPALLFFLVYQYMRLLIKEKNSSTHVLACVSAGILVTLGYDLVDYGTLLHTLQGVTHPTNFLIWARPVNPILGALFLFSFLISLYCFLRDSTRCTYWYVCAVVCLSFMMASYFFAWSYTLCIAGLLGVWYVIKADYERVRRIVGVVGGAILLSLPYWYIVSRATQSPWYKDAQGLMGVFHIHTLFLNKLLLLVGVLFLIAYGIKRNVVSLSWVFVGASIIGGLVALNQQVLTGFAVWPYHYVQYTIPLFLVAFTYILYVYIRPWRSWIAEGCMYALCTLSIIYAVYSQYTVYAFSYDRFSQAQPYQEVASWLTHNTPKDSVVLVNESDDEYFTKIIPAFTHNNVYVSSYRFTLIADPHTRFLRNYFSLLRLRGVTPRTIDQYVRDHHDEAVTLLGSQWQSLLSTPGIDRIQDTYLDETLANLTSRYTEYFKKDFLSELRLYRIDYILSKGALLEHVRAQLGNPYPVIDIQGIYIYDLSKKSS